MSFWDKVKNFTQPYGDDEYDDYDDEYMDDYEEPAEEPAPRPRRAAPVATAEEEDDEFTANFSTASNMSVGSSASAAPSAGGFNGQVLNMRTSKQEVVLFRPTSFNDTSKAADDLRNRKAVVVNLENVDKAMSRRVVDFLSGCVYAVDGSVKKIAQSAYLFCPHNMEVIGDLESLQAEVESYI